MAYFARNRHQLLPIFGAKRRDYMEFRSSGKVHLLQKWVRKTLISLHSGRRKQFIRKGKDTIRQPERRDIESPLRIASTRRSSITYAAKQKELIYYNLIISVAY